MAWETEFDIKSYEPTIRYDYLISGVVGPINEGGSYESRRFVKKRIRKNTPNWRYYVLNNLWKPENQYGLWKEKIPFFPGCPTMSPYRKLVWLPTGEYSLYHSPAKGAGFYLAVYPTPSEAERAEHFAQLDTKILTKIKNQNVNLGVFLAEREQMIRMLGQTVNRLWRSLRALRQGRFRDAAKILGAGTSRKVNPSKSLAQNWLELQYGWLPLLSDVYGAAQEFELILERLYQRQPITRVKAKKRVEKSVNHVGSGNTTTGWQGWTGKTNSSTLYRVTCNYTVDLASARFLSRIGLTNPLEIAWEALPYSFVVDWLLPVGRWLSTLDATIGCVFVSGTRSFLIEADSTVQREWSSIGGNYGDYVNYGPNRASLVHYERAPMLDFPAVTLPQLKNPVSKLHLANALALLRQGFSRK